VLAEIGFASGHLSGVSLVVFTGQVKQTVEEEDFNFDMEGMGEMGGLAGGGVERDGEVAGVLFFERAAREGVGGKAEDVGGLILSTEGAIEALEFGVGGKENVNMAGERDGGAGTVEEARQAGFIERGVGTGWRFDVDHRS